MRMTDEIWKWLAVAGLAAAAVANVGCHIDSRKQNGDENVKIATPFGGMSVKTDDSVAEGGVGLSVYPGATLVKKENGKDNGAADVNMSFGSFHLGVKALSYRTSDSPDKVMAFYRKDMARYGTVIHCRNNHTIGQPDRTQDGLSCEHNGNSRMQMNDEDAKNDQLKAGSLSHQHIVAIDPEGSGTKIGLIALDLPGKLLSGNGDEGKQ